MAPYNCAIKLNAVNYTRHIQASGQITANDYLCNCGAVESVLLCACIPEEKQLAAPAVLYFICYNVLFQQKTRDKTMYVNDVNTRINTDVSPAHD